MLYRVLSVSLTVLALTAFAAAQQQQANTHEGTVVSTTANKLVMKTKAEPGQPAREHAHTLAPGAKVTCDGKACKLDDLKAGEKVRVTTKAGDATVAIRVEALDKQRTFSPAGGGGQN
jgi:hypothetical protein